MNTPVPEGPHPQTCQPWGPLLSTENVCTGRESKNTKDSPIALNEAAVHLNKPKITKQLAINRIPIVGQRTKRKKKEECRPPG